MEMRLISSFILESKSDSNLIFGAYVEFVVPANPLDLGYANEACIANANCLGRKLAL